MLLQIITMLLLSHIHIQAQENEINKTLNQINKLIKSRSPYRGELEISNDNLFHHQEVNKGLRKIAFNEIDTIVYLYDRYDPNDAPYSVELKCRKGRCAEVNWVDGEDMSYHALIFSFRSKNDALKALDLFKRLHELIPSG